MPARALCLLAALALLVACDGATSPADGGALDAAEPATDAAGAADAAPDAGGPACAEDVRAPYAGPTPCSRATADCAAACDTAACASDCFLRDPSPDCIGCWDLNQLACWNRNGCQAEWNCVSECIRTSCPSPTPACIGASCAAEDRAYADCFEPHYTTCLERTVDCLPPRD